MKLIYPAIFHKDENSYWVTFPDLIGCQSFGDTIDETLENGKEALEGYCLNILESNKKMPTPSNIQDIKVEKDCFSTLINEEDFDPFYSSKNMNRLKKSIEQMENNGGTIHEVNYDQDLDR